MKKAELADLFLPYQRRWLQDKSPVKIFEKSRRIGGTWVQSFEDVTDCIEQPGLKVYFSSADLTAASEYIDYCEEWVRKLNAVAGLIAETQQGDLDGVEFADEDKGVKSKIIEFHNGSKIITLSSNPKAFRSKGGKIVWDESAWHDNDQKMWAAAKPAAMWGYPIRILSTHNGVGSVFNLLIEKVRKGEIDYSLHSVPITLAVAEGVADRIIGRKLTADERNAWLERERKGCLSDSIWQQEYMCRPQDESKALLSYQLIQSCEAKNILAPLRNCSGDLFLGMDVARRRHLSVIYVLEKQASTLYVRYLMAMHKAKWSKQEQVLYSLLALPRMRRACLDATGLGDQFAERAQEAYGKNRVEAIKFTGAVKEDMALSLLREFEDCTLQIPDDVDQRESLHSVRKLITASNNVRFDAVASDQGHGDYFWGLALAVLAARDKNGGPAFAFSMNPWEFPSDEQIRDDMERARAQADNWFMNHGQWY